jgi:hypothetical protein
MRYCNTSYKVEFEVKQSDEDIARLENEAAEAEDNGSKFPGMSYEQGIMETLRWLQGDSDDFPMDD